MTKWGPNTAATLLVLSAPTLALADSASMTMKGTKFSFELVRSAGPSPTQLGSGVTTGDGEGYRILYDSKQGRFFGYSVKATPLPEQRFRLELGPLSRATIARLADQYERRTGQKLVGAPLAIEYPPAQEVLDSEPLLLELMANPVTGEKLSDVIRVSSTTPLPEPWKLTVMKGTVKINGEELKSSGGCAGRYVWFSLPGRGRFVVSAEEVPGYDFTPAELIDNRIIKFAAAGDTYEWTSTHPVATGVPVPERLWVWHDTETMPNGGHGAMDTLPKR